MIDRSRAKTTAAGVAVRVASRLSARHYIGLDYPPNEGNLPRYTRSHPNEALRAMLAKSHDRYADALATIRRYDEALRALPRRAADASQPSLINDFLPGLDSAALYGFIRDGKPERYVEIGSGNSTKFAARAKADGHLATKITSIDPHPRAEIDALCDTVIRQPLEFAADAFQHVRSGDIVFFDGSHSVYMGNDIVVFFLEIVPALPTGVLVGIHDCRDVVTPQDSAGLQAERDDCLARRVRGILGHREHPARVDHDVLVDLRRSLDRREISRPGARERRADAGAVGEPVVRGVHRERLRRAATAASAAPGSATRSAAAPTNPAARIHLSRRGLLIPSSRICCPPASSPFGPTRLPRCDRHGPAPPNGR
jgi:hypothetical protein